MSEHSCHTHHPFHTGDRSYRKTLWVVLAINLVMFVAEIIAGLAAGSVSLQADAIDFLGDSANYAISLYVIGKPLHTRANSSLIKSGCMALFGVWVLAQTGYKIMTGTPPSAEIMGVVGCIALAANVISFILLSRHSHADSNRKSAWLCTRNDAIGNMAVIVSAGLVYVTASHWPDIAVALIMSGLALTSAWTITKLALKERKQS